MSLFTELKACLLVAPKSDIRYYLNGVLVTSNGLTATDGSMLIRIETELDLATDKSFIICRHDLAKKIKLFTKKDDLKLAVKDHELFLNEYKLELLDGRFPDVGRAINSQFSDDVDHKEIGVNLSYLSALSKAVSVALNTKTNCAMLTMYDRGLTLSLKHVLGGLMATRL